MTEFNSRVAGIPCVIRIQYAEPFTVGFISGPPERCYPDEGGLLVWQVLDRRGRPAPWLERKLTPAELDRIDDQAWAVLAAEAEDARSDRLIDDYLRGHI